MSVFEVVITGVLYVFVVLALIIGLLGLLALIFKKKKKTKATPVKEIDNEDIPAVAENREDDEIAAVIAAAVSTFEEENGKRKFKILSFRRVGDSSPTDR